MNDIDKIKLENQQIKEENNQLKEENIKLKEHLKKSIKNIKAESYKNYFIYAYNKDYYKEKRKSSKKKSICISNKQRTLKVYNT